MFRSTGLINLRSILADRIARGLVAIFAVTLLQGIFTGPEVVFADESPAIEISAPTITTTFGEEASGVISAVGGTPGYTFGYTGSVPGVSFAYIDSTSVGVQVAANAPPGTYRETITATDIANKRSAAPFEIRILKAPRTIQVIAPLSSLNQEETMSLTTIVDSTIRDELKPIMSNDGVLSYQSSTPSICSVNQNTGEVKAIAPSGQCQITATVVGGTYFENATSNFSLSVATPPPEQTPPAQQEPITPTSEPSPSPTPEPTPEPSSEPTPEPTPSSDEAAEVPMTMSSFSASNSATLIFQSNNGSGTSTTQIEGGPANLTANPFTRIGYTFLGWNTDSSASTPLYQEGAVEVNRILVRATTATNPDLLTGLDIVNGFGLIPNSYTDCSTGLRPYCRTDGYISVDYYQGRYSFVFETPLVTMARADSYTVTTSDGLPGD